MKGKQGKKKRWTRIVSLLLMVVALFAGYYVYSMFSFVHDVSTNRSISQTDNPIMTAKWEGEDQVNILFLGVDRRKPEEHPRSDTMLLLSVNPVTKKAALFSIMRDTYVDIDGVGQSKINAAFANGGPDLLIRTIQDFLQVPIHFYVATDFEGFSKIIDEIGGVDVNVQQDMVHYDDGIYNINLKAGQQHLDGKHALMYARFRDPLRSDFGRTERQRELMKIVAGEFKSPGMLLKLPSILKAVTPYTESNISADQMLKLAALALKVDSSAMKMEQVPPVQYLSETQNMYGEAILWPDKDGTREYVQQVIANTKRASTANDGTDGTDGTQGTDRGNGDASNVGNDTAPATQGQSQSTTAPQTSTPSGPTVRVIGEYVNLRAKPGLDTNVIGQVYKDQMLKLIDTIGDWYYIQTEDGMYGYITASLVEKQ
ncbi:MAG TPA: LCP family protein [Bacilli bacterium]|nr:LCP family protein [Bacilli bacterium]